MKKRTILIVGLIIAMIVAGALYVSYNGSPSRLIWKETYTFDDKNPYGGYLAYELLKERFKESGFLDISESISFSLDSTDSLSTYCFIGPSIYLSTSELLHLQDFIQAGNTVFISTKVFDYNDLLPVSIKGESCAGFYSFWKPIDTVYTNFYDIGYKRTEDYRCIYNRPVWNKLSNSDYYIFLDSCDGIQALGYDISLGYAECNFMKILIGEGTLLLHSQPMLFSNYFLSSEDGLDYFEKVFSYLPNQTTHWDAISKLPFVDGPLDSKSPLVYILSQPSLSWAWYLLLTTGLLYLIFNYKRIQRPIPVLSMPENTSRQYIKTLGSVFIQTKRHDRLMEMKLKLFYDELRMRYRLRGDPFSTNWISELAYRTNISKDEWQKLTNRITDLQTKKEISGTDLLALGRHLDKIRNIINK